VSEISRENDRIERIEEERLTTADLAGAGQEERARDEAANVQPSGVQTSGEPGEVIRVGREDNRNLSEPGSTKPNPGQSVPAPRSAAIGVAVGTATAMAKEPESGPLFSQEEAGTLRARWDAIQVGFVDEPRRAVEEADSLVATAMKRLAEQFAEERSKLEGQWARGADVSTEDLRIALRRYRSFFGRLLAV
jgi:hypothetical protein